MSGTDMSQADYDGRTALHLCAAEGHARCVRFLLDKCHVPLYPKDRYKLHYTTVVNPTRNYRIYLYVIHTVHPCLWHENHISSRVKQFSYIVWCEPLLHTKRCTFLKTAAVRIR